MLPLKFALGLFRCRGTVMLRSLPQIVFACAWAVACKYLYAWQAYDIPPLFWTPLYTVTVFLAIFRTNNAFSKYTEGRSCLGQMVDSLSACVRMAVSIEGLHSGAYAMKASEIVRLTKTVAAMIRVDLRESKIPPGGSTFWDNTAWAAKFLEGLPDDDDDDDDDDNNDADIGTAPATNDGGGGGNKQRSGSGMAAVSPLHSDVSTFPFWVRNDTFGFPSLKDLLTVEEIRMYSKYTPSKRVVIATGALLKEFSKFAPAVATASFESHVNKATLSWRGAAKIVDSPLPFSYSHLMHLMLFLVITLGTPVAISSYPGLGWVAVPLSIPATFLLYGLEEMAEEISNPFGWDVNDHDVSRFCKGLSRECDALLACLRPGA